MQDQPNFEPEKKVTEKVDELFKEFTLIQLAQLVALISAGMANFLITAKHKQNGQKKSF